MSFKFVHIVLIFMGWIIIPIHYSNAQILNYETKIKIEKGKKVTERAFLIQINSKEDNYLAKVKVSHNPNEDFSLIAAKIRDSKGKLVRKLKKREVKTKNDLSNAVFYQDDLVEEFELYWTNYPYQIEYSYRLIEKEFMYVTNWQLPINSHVAILKSSLQVEIPEDYEIYLDYSEKLKFEASTANHKKFLKWTIGLIETTKHEIYSPPLRELIPRVTIVPVNFLYGIHGNTGSWAAFGTWFLALNKGVDELPLVEKEIVNNLVKDVKDRKEIVKKLYQYLQDKTKYINVSIDVGGYKSYPASYVSQNKYGDCKALTTFMKAMLNHLSIDSYYTLINSGTNAAKLNIDLPSQQFNHVILAVPLKSDTIWLENTSNSSPFNYMGTNNQNRFALLMKNTGSEIVQTPKLNAADVIEKRTYNFDLRDTGICQVSISKDLRGRAFEKYRFYKTQASAEYQEELVLNDISIKDIDVTNWEIIDTNRDNKNIIISILGNCTSQIREIGDLKVINPLKISIPKFEEPQKRILDVRINYPIVKSDSIVYHIPNLSGYDTQLPKSIDLSTKYGNYKTTYAIIKNELFVYESFSLNSGEYQLEEYPKFYSFINEITNYKRKSQIILK